MSGKKDAGAHMGGLIVIKDDQVLDQQAKCRLMPYEGFPTYGGLNGRDTEVFAIGLENSVKYEFLHQRTSQVKKLGIIYRFE